MAGEEQAAAAPPISPAMQGMEAASQFFQHMNPQQPQQTPTQGTTQMGPSMKAAPKPPGSNFQAKGVVGAIALIAQKLEKRKEREQGEIFDKFTQSVAGIQDAQGQLQEAQKSAKEATEKLKTNPQDPEARAAYQEAAQRIQQAQSAMQINKTNLDDMFGGAKGEKHAKMLSKGFGIDDKNADTPERKQAIASIKKQLGVGDKAASLISRQPQTMQLSPGAKQQQMDVQAGVVGKPATGGQQLTHADNAAKLTQNQQFKTTAQLLEAEKIQNKAGQDSSKLAMALPAIGLIAERDADGSVKRAPDGTLMTRNLTAADVAGNPELSAKMRQQQAKTDLEVAQAKSTQVRAQVAQMAEQRKTTEMTQARDPGAVANWGKLVSDPSSGTTLAMVPSAARSAVVKWAADNGKVISKPLTSDELKRTDLASNAVSNIAVAKDILKNRPDMFGPAGWGKTKFEKALSGGDPDAVNFQAAVTLANLPAVGIHGVRGQWAIEDLDKLDGNLYLNPGSMGNVLDQIDRSASEFQEMGGRRTQATSPQNTGSKIVVSAEDMK